MHVSACSMSAILFLFYWQEFLLVNLETIALGQGKLFLEVGTSFLFCSLLRKQWAAHDDNRCGLISVGWPSCLMRHNAHASPPSRMPPLLQECLGHMRRARKPRERGGNSLSSPSPMTVSGRWLIWRERVHFSIPNLACFLVQLLWIFASILCQIH